MQGCVANMNTKRYNLYGGRFVKVSELPVHLRSQQSHPPSRDVSQRSAGKNIKTSMHGLFTAA